jgi:hypothetical protein
VSVKKVLIVIGLLLAGAGISGFLRAEKPVEHITGWAWSEAYGWMSSHCENTYGGLLQNRCASSVINPDCDGEACVDYGLRVSGENLVGDMWSSNLGWISFNQTSGFPAGPNHGVKNFGNNGLTGWAKALSLDSLGWLKLQGESCDGNSKCLVGRAAPYELDAAPLDGAGAVCYGCKEVMKTCVGGEFNGLACQRNEQCGLGEGAGTCTGPYIQQAGGELLCDMCFSEYGPTACLANDTCAYDGVYPMGNACFGDAADQYSRCSDCTEYTDADGNVLTSCRQCDACYTYGVGYDEKEQRLLGWAWGGNDGNGVGWVLFGAENAVHGGPWLETRLGSVLSEKGIGSELIYEPPRGRTNADYRVMAGGDIFNFNTDSGEEFLLSSRDGQQTFATLRESIDWAGLTGGVYGQVIPISRALDIRRQLDGKVYAHSGDLYIDTPILFEANPSGSGAGAIVVDGDLYVDADVTYSDDSFVSLRNMPSVAWYVKGDVIINPRVETFSGSIFVLGSDAVEGCESQRNSCGRFDTGASSTAFDFYGIIVARDLSLGRTYFSTERGAERFIYDGRAILNTPPGMGDMQQYLPEWKKGN